MLVAQMFAALMVWLLYGLFQHRRSAYLFRKLQGWDRKTRVTRATLLLVGSPFVLGLIYLVHLGGGFLENGMLPWAWAAVAVIGIVFVHMQTLAFAMLVSVSGYGGTRVQPPPAKVEEEGSDS